MSFSIKEKFASKVAFLDLIQHTLHLFAEHDSLFDSFEMSEVHAHIVFDTLSAYDTAETLYYHHYLELGAYCNHRILFHPKRWEMEFFNKDELGYQIKTKSWNSITLSKEIYSLQEARTMIDFLNQEEKEKTMKDKNMYSLEAFGLANNCEMFQ